MPFSILHGCLVASGLLFTLKGGWPQAVVFLSFGGVIATQEYLERHGRLAQQLKAATDEMSAKVEQVKSLDNRVTQLTERMLRYETRPR